MILLDTSVLAAVFGRRPKGAPEPRAAEVVREMLREDAPLGIPGVVLQEVLSGVRAEAHVGRLRELLEGFPILTAEPRHHVEAARIARICRHRGLRPSAGHCLISALAADREALLFTLDEGFVRMAPHCGVRLFGVGEASEGPRRRHVIKGRHHG